MKSIISVLVVLLVGCATPVKMEFPEAPEKLTEPAKRLNTIYNQEGKPTLPLSTLMETVVENYGICHENAVKYEAWQQWHKTQKKIFDDKMK